jgi:hypothetical protein
MKYTSHSIMVVTPSKDLKINSRKKTSASFVYLSLMLKKAAALIDTFCISNEA